MSSSSRARTARRDAFGDDLSEGSLIGLALARVIHRAPARRRHGDVAYQAVGDPDPGPEGRPPIGVHRRRGASQRLCGGKSTQHQFRYRPRGARYRRAATVAASTLARAAIENAMRRFAQCHLLDLKPVHTFGCLPVSRPRGVVWTLVRPRSAGGAYCGPPLP